jgi:hypothetical protein
MAVEEERNAPVLDLLKDGLHPAMLRTCPNEVPFSPLAENKAQGAKNDRLARSCLPGNGNEARPQLPGHLFDQSQVSNAQRGERCGHGRTMP